MLAKNNVCSITVTGQKQVSIGRSVRKYVSIIFKPITEFKHVDESTCYEYNKNTLSMGNAEVELMEINHLIRISSSIYINRYTT
jgi:hypothetical protein